jgi:hypothetical protein
MLTSSFALAQETTPAATNLNLCDVSFGNYVISVPCDWKDWKLVDYSTESEGVTAYTNLLTSIDSRIVFPQPPNLHTMQYIAIGPQLVDDQLVVIRVNTTTYSEVSDMGQQPEDVLSAAMMVMQFEPLGWLTINGRLALLGTAPWTSDQGDPRMNLALLVIVPEQDALVLVLTGASPGFYASDSENLMLTMLTSLRLQAEDRDMAAIASMRTTATQGSLLPTVTTDPNLVPTPFGL